MLQEEFDKACQFISHVNDILAVMNCKKLKLYDGSECMKLASEEVLFETGNLHVELSDQFRATFLENQCSLLEANYEAFLRENHVMHAQLTGKSS